MATNTAHHLFTDKAEAYARYRPKYPPVVFDFILKPFDNPEEIKAVDVGAGTGIASRLLADRGPRVIAAEPNLAMIESAESHPRINYIHTNAEDLPLLKHSADLITVFQAFHWFNFRKSLKHFKRILKPDGKISIIWSYWDNSDAFTAEYSKLIRNAADKNPDRVSPYSGFPSGLVKRVRMKMLWKIHYLPYFSNVQQFTHRYKREVDLDDLIGDAFSQSYLLHEGPVWADLKKEIERLYLRSDRPSLCYNINVFTGSPE